MAALGHDFQASKSWLYSRSQATLDAAATHPLAQQMQVAAPEEGLRVMGAPTGDEDWCRSWLEDKMLGLSSAFEEIEKLSEHDNDNSLQAAFLLLRYSASQRIGHLRTGRGRHATAHPARRTPYETALGRLGSENRKKRVVLGFFRLHPFVHG